MRMFNELGGNREHATPGARKTMDYTAERKVITKIIIDYTAR